jgi:DNA-directed RNA polymerase subunit beta'
VLYFAQYIVTYVDEDARQKASSAWMTRSALSERELGEKINAQIVEEKKNRDKALKEKDVERDQLKESYDEQIGKRIDPVIKEGQRLRE